MTYRIGVRALCQFTAKAGDLDHRFTPAPTGRQGIAGHVAVASRRGAGYQIEVALSAEEGLLHIRGRADGYLAAERRVEECKTHRGPVERVPENHRNLHWAQLQTYAAMLCRRDGLEQAQLALVYFNIDSQEETVFEEVQSVHTLTDLLRHRCDLFTAWAQRELTHKAQRDASLEHLQFPFGSLHAEQRTLAEAAYRAAANSAILLAEAPTGVGKTLGTLFPLLKALAAQKIDKIFYLAAKSTGRDIARGALAQLQSANPQLRLRVLDLVARDKACLHPQAACHGDSCPLARGFYDRLAGARDAAVECEVMDQAALRAIALQHDVCPYYLSQEMVRWSDVVIADYNHYFDSSALLHALVRENEWRVGVLVDEAHNLLQRARQMYSATLTLAGLDAAVAAAPAALRPVLKRITRCWSAVTAERQQSRRVLEELPEALHVALRESVARLSDWAAIQTDGLPAPVQQFYFDALGFLRLVDSLGSHSLLDSTVGEAGQGESLNLHNIVPATFLASRFDAAHATILFSATLSPRDYYQDLLGLAGKSRWLSVGSPFSAGQLAVRVVTDVSTRFRQRANSLPAIVSLIGNEFAKYPGNYLLFAGSFDYLRQVQTLLAQRFPHIPLWSQTSAMPEKERQAFVERFTVHGRGIGLAVLGGAFAEGIDLPGRRLVGAFVLTLGLPPVNALNEEVRGRLQALGGRGYEYTYLYPGMQRVVQAAGRIIRSTADEGRLYLLDSRYVQPEVAELLPDWWAVRTMRAAGETAG